MCVKLYVNTSHELLFRNYVSSSIPEGNMLNTSGSIVVDVLLKIRIINNIHLDLFRAQCYKKSFSVATPLNTVKFERQDFGSSNPYY